MDHGNHPLFEHWGRLTRVSDQHRSLCNEQLMNLPQAERDSPRLTPLKNALPEEVGWDDLKLCILRFKLEACLVQEGTWCPC